jgi:hypothetical protein
MKRNERKSVKIDTGTAKELLIEKAHTGTDIYELIRISWEAYKREKEGQESQRQEVRLAPGAGVELFRLIEKAEAGEGDWPLIRTTPTPNGLVLSIADPALESDDQDAPPIPIISGHTQPTLNQLSPDERAHALAAVALLREGDEDKTQLLRMLLGRYIGRPVEIIRDPKRKSA